MVQSHSENRWFLDVWNAAKESTSLAVFGRAFQSLGAELENALKPNCFLFVFVLVFFLAPLYRHGCDDERRVMQEYVRE